MTSQQDNKRAVGRKYVIACDGTWQNSDMGYDKMIGAPDTAQIPSNVTRIVRAINHRDEAGISQIVFYQRGVGSDGNEQDKYVGGLTGNDLSEHVREAYGFLANNFNPETQAELEDMNKPLDQIVLLGFSRGAFTARAIASLISDIGLLTRTGMESFWGIFGDWMAQDTKKFSPWFEDTYGEKIKFTDEKYRNTLIRDKLTRWGMPIHAVGVWDTVGALGIPMPWGEKNVKEFSFVNTKVPRHVLYAFHALALDEHRNLFTPTLWEAPDPQKITPCGFSHPHKLLHLKQTWFPGVHSNVGGSYADAGISNITLAWMVSQLEETEGGGLLSFNHDYLDWVQDKDLNRSHRIWGLGRIYDSDPDDTILGRLQGINPIVRTPGRYHEISTDTGKPTNVPLANTNEFIHPSVRIRMNEHGPGEEVDAADNVLEKLVGLMKTIMNKAGIKVYSSAALKNFTLVQSDAVKIESDHGKQRAGEVIWKAKDGSKDIKEDVLGKTELRLLERSIKILGSKGGHH